MPFYSPGTQEDIKALINKHAPPELPECSVRAHPDGLGFDVSFRTTDYPWDICGFTLREQTNCCGVMVSTSTWVGGNHRGKGLAQKMMPLKELIASYEGYSALVATVQSENKPEMHILQKFGWVKGYEFLNARTGNMISFMFKKLDNNNNKEQNNAVPELQRSPV